VERSSLERHVVQSKEAASAGKVTQVAFIPPSPPLLRLRPSNPRSDSLLTQGARSSLHHVDCAQEPRLQCGSLFGRRTHRGLEQLPDNETELSENLQFNGHHGHLMVTPGWHFHVLTTA
jgi:hypothetical protein